MPVDLSGSAADGRAWSVSGSVSPGYETVAQRFAENFDFHGERGAACAVTVDGRPVVDLWGGVADSRNGRPWERDTLQLIFSGTKGLVALCMLMLIDRGLLRIDKPVSRYWPEFGVGGKGVVTVEEVLSHQCRLPGLEQPATVEDILDPIEMGARLARQELDRDPRAGTTYHAMTYGWLCAELIRRVDGRSVGEFFDQEVAQPLALEIWIGCPESQLDRVARLEHAADWQGLSSDDASDPLMHRVMNNPPLMGPDLFWNDRELLMAQVPGGNAVATARSMARLYGCLAMGGELEGVRVVSEAVLRTAGIVRTRRLDPLQDWYPHAFGLGFQLENGLSIFGPPGDSFGHPGMGGSVHGAWPGLRVGFSYAMNQMRNSQWVDPRSAIVLRAVHDSVLSASHP